MKRSFLAAMTFLFACGARSDLEDAAGGPAGSTESSTTVSGASSTAASVGSSSTGSGGGQGGGGPVCPLTNDLLDPREVYLAGTLSRGSCGKDALAHWCDPSSAVTGFDCYFDSRGATIRPSDGRLLYTNTFEDVVREFHCDACPFAGAYPDTPLANDTIVSTPCAEVESFLVSPEGDVVSRCPDDHYYAESGAQLYPWPGSSEASLLHLGYGGQALASAHVIDLVAGTEAPIVGVAPGGDIRAARARVEGGFFMVVQDVNDARSLYAVDTTGAAALVGSYPPLPPGITGDPWSARLDASGTMFDLAWGPDVFEDVIVRRSVGGSVDIVYDEAADPLVKIHISSLFTGP